MKKPPLPGELVQKLWGPDQILMAFAPFPTKGPYPVMPRYFSRFGSVGLPDDCEKIDLSFNKYFEAKNMRLIPCQSDENILWLRPNLIAPMGYTLFIGSQMRKIEIVSQQEYLTSQLGYTSKQYTVDFTPLMKEKNHIFAKYDLKIPVEDTKINLQINCPNDKYLLDYLRIKIVDKRE